ncbi:hypothetical protein HYX16_01205 [Candidatus Woesearchaeota archaeon]|nr:hypothetical protein [Candidatus Woesearchaeota archaeon]
MKKDKIDLENLSDFDVQDMAMFFAPLVKLIEVGLDKKMTPTEIVRYAFDVFKEFSKEMTNIEKGLKEE